MGDAHGETPLGKWALRKEARRNMYATSTEKKCLRAGHWTYECQNEAVYVQRPSRSQQLKNPKLRQPFNTDKPPELQGKEEKASTVEKSKNKIKQKDRVKANKTKTNSQRKRHRSVSSSSSSSSSSESSSSSSGTSDSSGSLSSSSDSSGSESDSSSSSSDSDRSSRRKQRLKRQRRD